MGTPVFSRPRTVRVHVNIHNDKAGHANVFTIHTSGTCIPAREVRIACQGTFVHDLNGHARGVNPHLFFTAKARVYAFPDGVYELRAA